MQVLWVKKTGESIFYADQLENVVLAFVTQLCTFAFMSYPNSFFFPLYFLEILSNIMSYGKHMENQDFPTQSNFRHLRRS